MYSLDTGSLGPQLGAQQPITCSWLRPREDQIRSSPGT